MATIPGTYKYPTPTPTEAECFPQLINGLQQTITDIFTLFVNNPLMLALHPTLAGYRGRIREIQAPPTATVELVRKIQEDRKPIQDLLTNLSNDPCVQETLSIEAPATMQSVSDTTSLQESITQLTYLASRYKELSQIRHPQFLAYCCMIRDVLGFIHAHPVFAKSILFQPVLQAFSSQLPLIATRIPTNASVIIDSLSQNITACVKSYLNQFSCTPANSRRSYTWSNVQYDLLCYTSLYSTLDQWIIDAASNFTGKFADPAFLTSTYYERLNNAISNFPQIEELCLPFLSDAELDTMNADTLAKAQKLTNEHLQAIPVDIKVRVYTYLGHHDQNYNKYFLNLAEHTILCNTQAFKTSSAHLSQRDRECVVM